MNQAELQLTLIRSYSKMSEVNRKFSKRAFAKKLGINHSALLEIMSGKRRVSKKFATKICDKLMLSPKQRNKILSSNDTYLESDESLQLTSDQFYLISDWIHFAILNLINIAQISHSTDLFAQCLGRGIQETSKAIERLERLKLMEKKAEKWVRTRNSLKTSDEIMDTSIQLSHQKLLDLAQQKLQSIALEKRDFTSITMSINTKKLAKAKQLIRKFQNQMCDLLEDENADDVFAMSIQLFPLTNQGEKNEI